MTAEMSNAEFLEYIQKCDEKSDQENCILQNVGKEQDEKNLQDLQEIILKDWRKKVERAQKNEDDSALVFDGSSAVLDKNWRKFYQDTLHSEARYYELIHRLEKAVAPFELRVVQGGVVKTTKKQHMDRFCSSFRAGLYVYIEWAPRGYCSVQ
jgi:hypothetical protein